MNGYEVYYILASLVCGLVYALLRMIGYEKLRASAVTRKTEDWLFYVLVFVLTIFVLLFS